MAAKMSGTATVLLAPWCSLFLGFPRLTAVPGTFHAGLSGPATVSRDRRGNKPI